MAYFPNGTAGQYLDEQCAKCIYDRAPDDTGCPIDHIHCLFNYDQCDNEKLRQAMTLLVDEKGDCQMKVLIDKFYTKKEKPVDNSARSLFSN